MRDYALGSTVDYFFTTCAPDDGAPVTLSGTPAVSAYVDNSTTQITAGITLNVDFDGVTGLNHVRVVATSGNGYAAGTNVALVITTGTVDGVSAVGYKVAEFSIGRPATANVTQFGGTAGTFSAGRPEVNTTLIEGADATNTLDARIDARLAAYDPPTRAELTSDIGTVTSAIGELNDLSAAEVNAEVDTALADYDGPTNAEMEARTLAAASYATAADLATVDENVDAIKAKTDSLTFTVAGQVDANTQSINDVEITGDGQTGTEFNVAAE